MSTQERMPPPRNKASRIRYVLMDLSGTLHIGDSPIPGAVEAIHRLLSYSDNTHNDVKVLFLTNTTTISRQTLYESLHDTMGFDCIHKNQIMTSAHAVEHYVSRHNLHPFCLVESDLRKDLPFAQREEEEKGVDYDSVLVGLSPSSFHYDALNRAFRILRKHDASSSSSLQQQQEQNDNDEKSRAASREPSRLLSFHRSKYVKSSDGDLSLGPGGFVMCLEHTTSHTALVLGKPSATFFQAALTKLLATEDVNDGKATKSNSTSLVRDDVVMVGDDIINDIIGARDVGIGRQILVQTGKYQAGDENKYEPLSDDKINTSSPLVVVPSIVQAVDYILEHAADNE